jgi:hypothetical protein
MAISASRYEIDREETVERGRKERTNGLGTWQNLMRRQDGEVEKGK